MAKIKLNGKQQEVFELMQKFLKTDETGMRYGLWIGNNDETLIGQVYYIYNDDSGLRIHGYVDLGKMSGMEECYIDPNQLIKIFEAAKNNDQEFKDFLYVNSKQ